MSRRGVAAAVLVLALVAAAALPAPAHALWEPTPAQLQEMYEFLRYGSPYASPPNEGPVPPDAAWRAYQYERNALLDNAQNQLQRTRWQRLHSALIRARQRVGLLPRWSAFPSVAAIPVTGFIGYQIGSGINQKWLKFGINKAPDPGTVTNVRILRTNQGGSLMPGAPEVGFGGRTASEDGWTVMWDLSGGLGNITYGTLNMTPCNARPGPQMGEEWDMYEGQISCSNGTFPQTYHGEGTFSYFKETPGLPVGPWTSTNPGGLTLNGGNPMFGGPGPEPSATAVKSLLQSLLQANDFKDIGLLNDWFEYINDPLLHDDPASGLVRMPDCTGLSYNACITALQEAGFGVVTREIASFNTAIPLPEGAPNQVISTSPAAGSVANPENEVQVLTNPTSDDDMPRKVPAFGAREAFSAYEARLGDLSLGAQSQVNSYEAADPARGPDEVTQTQPAPGSRVHKNDDVTVNVNPPDWPSPGGSGGSGSCDPPAIRGFDLGPLMVPLGDHFPFGALSWLLNVFETWLATPAAPHWQFELIPDVVMTVDFAFLNPLMGVVRPALLLVSALGLVWMLAASAMRLNHPPDE